MNLPPIEGEERRKRLEFSISSEGSGETVSTEDSSTELLGRMHRAPSCVSNIQLCANQQKLEDLYKSYTKLKIYFCVLCVVNVIIILLVCGFFAVFFVRLSDNDTILDNFRSKSSPKVGDNVPAPGKTAALSAITELPTVQEAKIRCSVLTYKLNATQYDTDEMCSLEDMVDSIAKYLKPREYNDVLHLTDGSPQSDGSHCFLKDWVKDKDSSSPQNSGLKFSKERGAIIIPSNGYYYVYSRITFKYNPSIPIEHVMALKLKDTKHIIEKGKGLSNRYTTVQSASIQCTNKASVHSSFLQRVVYLNQGEELRVKMSDTGKIQYDERYKHENFFGVFKL